MKNFFAILISAAILGGCSAPKNLTVVERGEKPDIQMSLLLVHTYLKRNLKDYDSMKDFSIINDEIYPIIATNLAYDFEQAWMLCVEYNSKNSYGAYVGLSQHGFPLKIDSDGKPFILSTNTWRTHNNSKCN